MLVGWQPRIPPAATYEAPFRTVANVRRVSSGGERVPRGGALVAGLSACSIFAVTKLRVRRKAASGASSVRMTRQQTRQVEVTPLRKRRPIRPGNVSSVREVPESIPRPPYVDKTVPLCPRLGLPRHAFLYAVEIKTPEQIAGMRAACSLARAALEVAGRTVAPGVTTDEIDKAVHEFIISNGAYPSPLGYLKFPKSIGVAVNDVVAHGIPDDRPLENGDILNVDVTVYLNGFHGDTSCMFIAGEASSPALKVCKAARRAMMAGIQVCGPGVDFRAVGHAIERVADEEGFVSVDYFAGHGIGSYFHGAPQVLHQRNDVEEGVMLPGLTFTVEPILVHPRGYDHFVWKDGWTHQSVQNYLSAQFEHTILITEAGHEILTGPCIDYLALNKAHRRTGEASS